MTLILDYQDRLIRGSSYQPAPGTIFSYPGVGPLENRYDTYSGVNSQNAFRGGGVSLNIEQQLPFAKLVSITSYRRGVGETRFDDSAVKTPYFIFDSPTNPNEDYTQELQLVSPKGKFNWVTGVYYFHSSLATLPTTRDFSGFLAPLPTSAFQTNTFGTEVAESVAPFAQADYEILPKTKLTFGARYTYEDRDFNGRLVADLNNGAAPVTTRTGDIRIYKTTVRASLDHQFTDDVLGYLSYNTGIKSGGFNVLNITNPAYLPEELTAYEAGVKTEFLDKRARLNVAGFYYNYDNIQVIQFTNGIQSIVNGAGAEVYGVDVDYAYEIARGLRVSGGFEAEHAEFTSFPGAVFSTPKPTGGAVLFPGDAKGKRLPLSQEFAGTLGVDYHLPTEHGDFDADVTANYNGKYFFEPDNRLSQGAYTLLNASLKWTPPHAGYSLTLWARNLLDYAVASQEITQAFGYSAAYANAPRTFGATARIAF